jgi:ankyrin repeat protein
MTQQSFAQVFKQKCRDGDAKAVRRILSTRGGKSRLSDEDFNRGFYAAIDQGHTDVISLLLDHGASMSDEALARVCEHDNAQVVKLFLDYGWDPNTMFVYGEPGLRASVTCTNRIPRSSAG